jgi:hypothetical protein
VSERHVDLHEDAIGVGVVVHRLGTPVVAGSGGVRCGPLHVCVLLADEHELQGVGLGILPNLQKHLAGDGAARVDGELIELDAEGARARGVAHYGAGSTTK